MYKGVDHPPKNDHSKVLVPLETWEYNSPILKYRGHHTDLGLLAEALLYYDQVYVDVPSEVHLDAFLRWGIRDGHINNIIELLENGILKLHYHAFMTSAINTGSSFSLVNIQDSSQARGHSFFPKVVNRTDMTYISKGKRHRLLNAIARNYVEVKADDYEPPIEDAKEALHNPDWCNLLLQTYLEEIFSRLRLGKPPKTKCWIESREPDTWTVTWDLNLDNIAALTEGRLDFRLDIPLIGEAHSDKFIWTASNEGLDLFVGEVMSTLTGNKLQEAGARENKIAHVLQDLKVHVLFPDIREAVNEGTLSLTEVLALRRKSGRFRSWLQQEGERDGNALIRYHHEVGKAAGFTRVVPRQLQLFGSLTTLASPAYSVITGNVSPEVELVVGAAGVVASQFLSLVGQRLTREWRPVIFGNWLRKKVDKDS